MLRHAADVVPGAKQLHRYLFPRIRPAEVTVEVQGLQVTVDPLDSVVAACLIRDGAWEPYETEVFLSSIQPGMVVVDVGANFGYYTLLAAKAVGPRGRVIGFEPDPQNFGLLRRNVAVNGFADRVTLVAGAVSDHKGSVPLFRDQDNFGAHSLAEGNVVGTDVLSVPCTSLDEALEADHVGHVDVIKIDTQGAEGLVFAGAERVLAQSVLRIFTEFWPLGLRRLGADPMQLLRSLTEVHGFRVFHLNPEEGLVIGVPTDEALVVAENQGHIDLLLVKP